MSQKFASGRSVGTRLSAHNFTKYFRAKKNSTDRSVIQTREFSAKNGIYIDNVMVFQKLEVLVIFQIFVAQKLFEVRTLKILKQIKKKLGFALSDVV